MSPTKADLEQELQELKESTTLDPPDAPFVVISDGITAPAATLEKAMDLALDHTWKARKKAHVYQKVRTTIPTGEPVDG